MTEADRERVREVVFDLAVDALTVDDTSSDELWRRYEIVERAHALTDRLLDDLATEGYEISIKERETTT
jgi:hypothetical protein